jgi:hypothetical protein
MTSEPIDGSADAQVVPLRVKDAGTDVRTTEAPGSAYADLSDGQAQRKAIIPAHWRTLEAAREHVKLAAARHAHAAAYHSVRAPAYVVLTAWWALVGMAAPSRCCWRGGMCPICTGWSGRPLLMGCYPITCGSTRPGGRCAPRGA